MKKITKEIIQRIEGEATLELEWEEDSISFAKIKFLNYRAIEEILKDKHLLDALMITPRICGICSHSHVISTVKAIENCYENIGVEFDITNKAKSIREIVLNAEKIQNHIKWFYFSILPELFKMNKKKFADTEQFRDKEWFEAQKAIANVIKMGAVFSGQWPHGSFVMPGGVTCDPTQSDIITAKSILDDVIEFLEEYLYGCRLEDFINLASVANLMNFNSTFDKSVSFMKEKGFNYIGKSYDRFIALGGYTGNERARKSVKTTIFNADSKFVKESLDNTFFSSKKGGYTYSKSALYKDAFYETGPLARMIISKDNLVRDCHRRCKDSSLARVIARVREIAILTERTKNLLNSIDLKEKSFQRARFMPKEITSKGEGIVEASRGTLIHRIDVKKGKINHYDIITPTVWNLGNGSMKNPSVAQKAIIGLKSVEKADFIFKSFDVCSVCTTQ